jgi:hypothetical protein
MKNLICISLLILFAIKVYAKVEKIKTIPATVILKNGDSLNVNMKLPNTENKACPSLYKNDTKLNTTLTKIQLQFIYIDDKGNSISLFPEDIIGFRFNWYNTPIKMISITNSLNKQDREKFIDMMDLENDVFLEANTEGNVSYYTYRKYSSTSGGSFSPIGFQGYNINSLSSTLNGAGCIITFHSMLYKKNNETLKIKNVISKTALQEFFSDCPSLVNLIKEDIATRDKLDIIVEFYNLYCK